MKKKNVWRITLSLFALLFSTFNVTLFSKANGAHAEIGRGKNVYTDVNGNVLSITTQPKEYAFEFNVLEEKEDVGTLELLRASENLVDVVMFDSFEYDEKTYIVTELKGNAFYSDVYSFKGHTNLKSITLPSTLKKIGQGAFEGCTLLESVVIPEEIESIDNGAFYGCSNLISVTINATTVPAINANAFTNCSEDLKIYVPYQAIEEYQSTLAGYADKFDYFVLVAIQDVLPDNFPTFNDVLPSYLWTNEEGVCVFKTQREGVDVLALITADLSKKLELTDDILTTYSKESEGNYVYISEEKYSITFVMLDGILTNINVEGITEEAYLEFNGTYQHRHAIAETIAKIEPTCLESGHEEYYQCGCGKYFADKNLTQEISNLQEWLAEGGEGYIDPLNHLYGGNPTYTWDEDKCTASWECQHDGCSETQSETVTGIYVKDSDATTTSNEKGHYEATFTISGFENQSTPFNSVEIPGTMLPPEGLSGGAVAGIVIGSVVLACIVAYITMLFVWKKKDKGLKFLIPSFKWIDKTILKNE